MGRKIVFLTWFIYNTLTVFHAAHTYWRTCPGILKVAFISTEFKQSEKWWIVLRNMKLQVSYTSNSHESRTVCFQVLYYSLLEINDSNYLYHWRSYRKIAAVAIDLTLDICVRKLHNEWIPWIWHTQVFMLRATSLEQHLPMISQDFCI